jgi:hypothetical protein
MKMVMDNEKSMYYKTKLTMAVHVFHIKMQIEPMSRQNLKKYANLQYYHIYFVWL